MSTVVMVGAFTPFTLPCLVPILLLFYFLYIFFQTSVREIKRLDAVSRSPVYSSLNDAINGLPTIKAFNAEQRLIKTHMDYVDANVRLNLVNQSMNRYTIEDCLTACYRICPLDQGFQISITVLSVPLNLGESPYYEIFEQYVARAD